MSASEAHEHLQLLLNQNLWDDINKGFLQSKFLQFTIFRSQMPLNELMTRRWVQWTEDSLCQAPEGNET